ncbi:hypothetical protein MOQ_003504 [Trypanosoma cruzi marinkellei]|uniref:Uncharacterized protein n=1 Tax=Trypanosoma cruzi marinkellei TaxID=85056 RepID=K2NCR7_TRYCR|nr:hypothetical protein MOQ_003504 [Trypanosoma cruzi marinkellei]
MHTLCALCVEECPLPPVINEDASHCCVFLFFFFFSAAFKKKKKKKTTTTFMALAVAPQDAVHHVEGTLRRWERHRQNQQRLLRLLTTIVETLEATKKHHSHEKCAAIAPFETLPLPAMNPFPSSSSSSSSPVGAARNGHGVAIKLDPSAQAALGDVLRTLSRSQQSIAAACSRFSWRVQNINEDVQRLCNVLSDGTSLVRKQLDVQRRGRVLEALLLAALATIVRSGCDDTSVTAEHPETERSNDQQEERVECPLAVPNASFHGISLRPYWQKEEHSFSAAIHDITGAYDCSACTTCNLLRSSLLETLSAQRCFPSPQVYRTRRAARYAWYREMNEATARRRAAQKSKWERHERMAEALSEGVMGYANCREDMK